MTKAIRPDGDYNFFQLIIHDIFRQTQMTKEEFSERLFKPIIHRELDAKQKIRLRENFGESLFRPGAMGGERFKIIMEQVLDRKIEKDSEEDQRIIIGIGKDLRGERFGRLVASCCLGMLGSNRKLHWRCVCFCDNETSVNSSDLLSGKTQSCGCLRSEMRTDQNMKHGMHGTASYSTWKAMNKRCSNPNTPVYPRYGGRGIKVCDRWRYSFENFYEDMGDRPENMTLDRKDNDGDYCKDNCRWATAEEQANNMRTTLRFEDGAPLAPWARVNDLNYGVANNRYHKGMTKAEIIADLGGDDRG